MTHLCAHGHLAWQWCQRKGQVVSKMNRIILWEPWLSPQNVPTFMASLVPLVCIVGYNTKQHIHNVKYFLTQHNYNIAIQDNFEMRMTVIFVEKSLTLHLHQNILCPPWIVIDSPATNFISAHSQLTVRKWHFIAKVKVLIYNMTKIKDSKLLPAVTAFYNPAMGCRVLTQQFRIQTHMHTVFTLSTYKVSFGVAHKTYFSWQTRRLFVSYFLLLSSLPFEFGRQPANKQLNSLSGVFSLNKEQVEVSGHSTTSPSAHV